MVSKKLRINRAPVLTLWAAVVAERLGHDKEAALTLGRTLAGLNAQSKGRRLGIFEASAEEGKERKPRVRLPGKELPVPLLGRTIPAVSTRQGLRATVDGVPVDPDGVRRYLQGKFGENLAATRMAMEALAKSYEPEELATRAFGLYEKFRPSIPEGKRGWGAAGELDLGYIRSLAK